MATMSKRKPPAALSWPDKLKLLRDRWGAPNKPVTQQAAADRIGVTRRSWVSWETGAREPVRSIQVLIDCLLSQA